MSLHARIVAWFVFFASLMVILFVLGDYFQSTRALSVVLETRAREIADRMAAEVERRYSRSQSELLALGYASAAGAPDPGAALVTSSGYAYIRVWRGNRVIWESSPSISAVHPTGCALGLATFDVPFRDGAGRAQRVEAAMPAVYFFDGIGAPRLGRGGITTVMQSADAALVFDQGCAIRSGAVPTSLERTVAARVIEANGSDPVRVHTIELEAVGEEKRVLAIARARQPDWSVVVGVDHTEFAAPFVAMRMKYLASMVAILGVTLLFVLRAIRNDMQRLGAISRAAHAIGHGHFDVWLPPPTNDEVGRVSLALGRMVDRLAATMRQMEITRAMVAVGELATYLSHEIRNPLSSIRLNLQMLRRDLKAGAVPDDAPQLVALCLSELQRLDNVVKTVLDVGRPPKQGSSRGVCDAHAVIVDTLQVMQTKLAAEGVSVDSRLQAEEADVELDASQLKSILINLLLNSVDALANSAEKTITITTELQQFERGDRQLALHIRDTGPGVPAHLRERIFEPFFTTKTHGNGIGLATALRIIQERGGVLRCEPTEWDRGAAFVLELQIVNAAAKKAQPRALVAAG